MSERSERNPGITSIRSRAREAGGSSHENFCRPFRGLFGFNKSATPRRIDLRNCGIDFPDESKEGKSAMTDWIVTIAIVSFVLYKLASLTEFDLGRGWLRLKFAVPRTQRLAKRKPAKK